METEHTRIVEKHRLLRIEICKGRLAYFKKDLNSLQKPNRLQSNAHKFASKITEKYSHVQSL